MLNTSNNDQYIMHMYYTVQVQVQYWVHCTVHWYSTKCIIIFCSAQFYLGGRGGLHTVQCRVYPYFLLGSILFGGLKHPQALMTRRPWFKHSDFDLIIYLKNQSNKHFHNSIKYRDNFCLNLIRRKCWFTYSSSDWDPKLYLVL